MLFRGRVPLPLRKVNFFRQNVLNIRYVLIKTFFLLKQFVCIGTPSLSIGSEIIFINKKEKKEIFFFFLPPKLVEGGGGGGELWGHVL